VKPSFARRLVLASIIILFCGCKAEVTPNTSTAETTVVEAAVNLEEIKTDAQLAARNTLGGSDTPLIREPSAATKKLTARNKMFQPEIIQLSDTVYVANGYTVSSNAMIIGSDGIIIIDPGNTVSASANVKAEFEKITDKPVKAIIYTHGDGDHINGAAAFYEEYRGIEIWQRTNFDSEKRHNEITGLSNSVRPSNSQGFDLRPEQKIGIGIAIPSAPQPLSDDLTIDGVQRNEVDANNSKTVLEPTHTFGQERRLLNISGVRMELVAAPGETEDQLYLWLPEQRILFAGDNFYQSWPNTYPLRGTARRSVRDWINSLSKI